MERRAEMQFQIACKHCRRSFVIASEQGKTVKCNCPYCGGAMMVVTPVMGTDGIVSHPVGQGVSGGNALRAGYSAAAGPASSERGFSQRNRVERKVTIVFFTLLIGVILLCSLLYLVFSAMSN